MRGCDPQWLRNNYRFAYFPDATFFFQVPLQTALSRILYGRPKLKFHEAGMDLNLSADPYESFALFQGKVDEIYHKMVSEYGFLTIDGNRPIPVIQQEIRKIVMERAELAAYFLDGQS